jgi:hypothetical protein
MAGTEDGTLDLVATVSAMREAGRDVVIYRRFSAVSGVLGRIGRDLHRVLGRPGSCLGDAG